MTVIVSFPRVWLHCGAVDGSGDHGRLNEVVEVLVQLLE